MSNPDWFAALAVLVACAVILAAGFAMAAYDRWIEIRAGVDLIRALDADLEGDGRVGPATAEHIARHRAADELGGAA